MKGDPIVAEELLSERQTALLLGMSCSFLRKARVEGNGPRYLKLGKAVRYSLNDIVVWLEDRKRSNTIQPYQAQA